MRKKVLCLCSLLIASNCYATKPFSTMEIQVGKEVVSFPNCQHISGTDIYMTLTNADGEMIKSCFSVVDGEMVAMNCTTKKPLCAMPEPLNAPELPTLSE